MASGSGGRVGLEDSVHLMTGGDAITEGTWHVVLPQGKNMKCRTDEKRKMQARRGQAIKDLTGTFSDSTHAKILKELNSRGSQYLVWE